MFSDFCAIFLTFYRDYTCKISILQQALFLGDIWKDSRALPCIKGAG